MADRSLAVIDVGSNSGRVVVIRIGEPGHLEILANGRAPLRLARDLRRGNRIAPETIERTAAALRDFRAIADSAGAGTLIAVATSAVRESENADEFQARIEAESGVGVRVISGDEEALYTFLGAVHGLPGQWRGGRSGRRKPGAHRIRRAPGPSVVDAPPRFPSPLRPLPQK